MVITSEEDTEQEVINTSLEEQKQLKYMTVRKDSSALFTLPSPWVTSAGLKSWEESSRPPESRLALCEPEVKPPAVSLIDFTACSLSPITALILPPLQ
ncbi:Protein THYLAKOID FORMATION1 [Musa troglodytarum]|uniref:Protein THYLAKOID FORMATION1 n=1 Tax=Musa troglodytarum TaxID=320322 RepID=A0A9E7HVL4_9LILI|nr:Protein THYLAKOID FORMATION1 [Musa troglodytarum]